MERLYYNIGQKLKKIAIISAIILSFACVIGGIVLMSNDYFKYHTTRNILLIFAGPFVSWLLSLPLYALGEIVDKLMQIEENTRRNGNQSGHIQNNVKKASSDTKDQKHNKIKKQPERDKKQTDESDEDYAIIQMWKNNGWICPNCGKLIGSGKASCYGCGFELSGKYELFVDLKEQLSGTCDICGSQSEDIREVHAEDNDCETDCRVCRSCLSNITEI